MPDDFDETMMSCRQAAVKGSLEAQFNLGLLYGMGLGVRQDYTEALEWYRKAAERGYAQAQNNLGWMHGTGRGVPQDYVQAYAWYSIAAAQGEETARENRDCLALVMTPSQLERSQNLAGELFNRLGMGKGDGSNQEEGGDSSSRSGRDVPSDE